jgi:hypothetical protein
MNAGRGRNYNQQISDLISSIKVFDGKKSFFLELDSKESENTGACSRVELRENKI